MRRARLALLALALLAAAAPRPAPADEHGSPDGLPVASPALPALPAPRRVAPKWDYHVTFAPDLSAVRVRWCLTNFIPKRCWLVDVLPLDGLTILSERGGRLVRDDQSDPALLVADMSGDACFEYSIPMKALSAQGAARGSGTALVVRPGAFLLRAGVVPDDLDATITIVPPAGMRVAVPYEPTGPSSYRLPPSTWPFQGWMIVGPLHGERLTVAGTEVELVRLDGTFAATAEGVRTWVRTAIEADAVLFGGTFPRKRLLVAVEPGGRGGDAVSFGSSWSGGGAHAFLWLSTAARDADLRGEWVAIHELIHAALPHIALEDAWMAEGFTTYYQEVVRARAGLRTPQQAWQEIHEGFGRGRVSKSPRSIAVDSREMHAHHAYHRVYWAGAAIGLRLDVALRRATGGRLSLDDALRAMQEHDNADRVTIRASEVIEALDRKAGSTLATQLVDPLLASSDFPDVEEAYRFLGLRDRDGQIELLDAPGAAIRDAIMAKGAAR